MNEQKIKEVFSDEAFVKSLLELETPEEVQEALEEKDIDFSIDEIKKIAEILQKNTDGELTDAELENVAGGSVALVVVGIVLGTITIGVAIKTLARRW